MPGNKIKMWAALGFLVATISPTAAAETVTVPFVGCPSGGQQGPQPPPTGDSRIVDLPAKVASRLAWYQDIWGSAVLAPRGWECLGWIGSNGGGLAAAPRIDPGTIYPKNMNRGVTFDSLLAGTSGRWGVANYLAIVFPKEGHVFVDEIDKMGFPERGHYHFGPYATDHLTYLGRHLVNFTTPPDAEGLGTLAHFSKAQSSISGYVSYNPSVETGGGLDVMSVRLPNDLKELAKFIIQFQQQLPSNPARKSTSPQ